MIAQAYKSRTTKDKLDTNIPLSVQPWGRDGEKRRYWLVEGQNDTHFRVYREGNPHTAKATWWSVAGSIDELRALAKVLDEDDGQREAKTLSERMINAVPRFEASEVVSTMRSMYFTPLTTTQKRKRREYRVNRTAAFTRPDPGFSLYEGRTRGKRQRYTYDEGDDFDSDDAPVRRSGRQSARDSSPIHSGPTVTASGRQVRSRATGTYGETLHSGQTTDRASPATGEYMRSDVSEEPRQGRSTRAGYQSGGSHLNRELDSEEDDDATSWDGGDEEEEPEQMELDDDEDDTADQSSEEEEDPQTLVVTLHYRKKPADTSSETKPEPTSLNGATYQEDVPMADAGAPPRQEVPAIAAVPPPHVIPTAIPNGFSAQQPVIVAAPKVESAQPPVDANALPKLDGFVSAPTPPYSAPEQAPKQEQPQFHPIKPEATQQPPFSTTLPVTTHAPNWQ